LTDGSDHLLKRFCIVFYFSPSIILMDMLIIGEI